VSLLQNKHTATSVTNTRAISSPLSLRNNTPRHTVKYFAGDSFKLIRRTISTGNKIQRTLRKQLVSASHFYADRVQSGKRIKQLNLLTAFRYFVGMDKERAALVSNCQTVAVNTDQEHCSSVETLVAQLTGLDEEFRELS